MKKAEKSDAVVLRLYEHANARAKATIAFGEQGPLPRPEPMAVVVERLLAMAHDARDDSSVYADVIARR